MYKTPIQKDIYSPYFELSPTTKNKNKFSCASEYILFVKKKYIKKMQQFSLKNNNKFRIVYGPILK